MPRARLSALDASFLRIETPTAHMHVAWKGRFAPPASGPRPTVGALRASVAGRLRHAERFRQRLAFPPGGLAEPVWVDDDAFAIEHHVAELGDRGEVLSGARFDALVDDVLSRPLDRDRPLWSIHLARELEDGSVGLAMKVHHAMVDGMSAVELALLLLDLGPEPRAAADPDGWVADPVPGPTRLALEALAAQSAEPLRAAGGLARLAASPRRGVRLAETLRRAAMAVGEDVLRPAPASFVNVPIGARRTLVHHTAELEPVLEARRRLGVTLNDVMLAAVAGALRDHAVGLGRTPAAMKVMVPVSTRGGADAGALGNRISFVFIDLPIHLHSAGARLGAVHEQTRRFKATGRAEGGEAILSAMGVLPEPLRDAAARLAASPRMYNLTVSNVPGPRVPVFLLGCELREAVPVIPIPDGHALSIGIFSHAGRISLGAYADPTALPEVQRLPGALAASLLELRELAARRPLLRAVA